MIKHDKSRIFTILDRNYGKNRSFRTTTKINNQYLLNNKGYRPSDKYTTRHNGNIKNKTVTNRILQ